MKKHDKMKKASLILFFLIFIAGMLMLSVKQHDSETTGKKLPISKKENQTAKQIPDEKPSLPAQLDQKVDALIQHMTLKEKIGQLMMVGFYGATPDSAINDLIQNEKIGGIIYFDRNMETPKQTAQLTNCLQKTAASVQGHEIPLLIGVDQEGGDILRMRNKVSPIPSQQQLSKSSTANGVYQIAKINGAELAAMGIHLNFAPVLDLSNQDSRSFGSGSQKTAELGKMVIKGLNKEKVTGVLKHFPGNGRSKTDPHLDTSSVPAGREKLEANDIVPFKQMIAEQDSSQFFIMVTHVKYPTLDPDQPASLSSKIITGLLRDQLRYHGIVVTDDLEMGAVSNYYSFKDLGKEAIKAGADLLLVCHEYNHQKEVYNGILSAVQSGEIKESRIDESVKRILTYKLKQHHPLYTNPDTAAQTVRSSPHQNVVKNNRGF